MFGSIGAPEIILGLVVIVLLFGVGKISGLGRDLGSSIKEFRKAVKDEDNEAESPAAQVQQSQPLPPPAAPPAQPSQPDQPKSNIF